SRRHVLSYLHLSFNATPPTELYTLSLHDALPISNALPWVGRLRDFQVPTPDGFVEFDWNWKAMYNHALYTLRPFMYIAFQFQSRSEEHTSELQSRGHLVCRLLLEKKKKATQTQYK